MPDNQTKLNYAGMEKSELRGRLAVRILKYRWWRSRTSGLAWLFGPENIRLSETFDLDLIEDDEWPSDRSDIGSRVLDRGTWENVGTVIEAMLKLGFGVKIEDENDGTVWRVVLLFPHRPDGRDHRDPDLERAALVAALKATDVLAEDAAAKEGEAES